MLHHTRVAVALVTGLIAFPKWSHSQVRLSERGTVTQIVDGTTLTVDFARPQARGRTIFGGQVRWGETWTPGANWATTLAVSKDVKVNGESLAKGTYSVWMVPTEQDWTVFFHSTAKLFHTQKPSPDSAVLRLTVKPAQGDPVEVLTFAFTEVGRDRTTLQFRWEKAIVPLVIEVPSSRPVLAMDRVPLYTGDWTVIMASDDAAVKKDTLDLKIELKDGRLMGTFAKMDWTIEVAPTRTLDTFLVGWLEKGQTMDVEADYPMVFTVDGDRATSFIVKSDTGDEWMRGVRKK